MSVFKSMDYIDMIKSVALEIQIVEFILLSEPHTDPFKSL